MVVKAPVLCQAHAEPVVKPLQKQDVEMKLKMMLECVGCGGDSGEQRLSSACFTLGAACTARLHPTGAGRAGGGCGSSAKVEGTARAFLSSRQTSHTAVFSLPCSGHALSAIQCFPAGTAAKNQGKTLVSENRLVLVHLVCMLPASELPGVTVPACAGPKPRPEPR